jgi:ABC-type transport system involved in cytochrome bd biosynthesis fused ATPase/permease subunit
VVNEDDDGHAAVNLSGDRAEVFFGVGVTAAALVAVAVFADVRLALILLIVVAGIYVALVLIVSAAARSLRRGIAGVTRWTFGFLGRWLPL